MSSIPASIRHRNPGAVGLGSPRSSARLFGAMNDTRLSTGYTIATFPTSVDGASAQFHLLWSPAYRGMSVWDALHKWGDGASLEKAGKVYEARQRTGGYVTSIERHSRFKRGDTITAAMMENPETAIEFAKAMAWHEAGREYPMTDAQWLEAHRQFMTVIGGGTVPIDRTSPLPVTAPLELAKTHIGQRRVLGSGTNPLIENYAKDIGSKLRGDDFAYCAVFTGGVLKESGFAYIEGEKGQLARNYLDYGHALDEPEEGAIVVFWRVAPNDWRGHVAFVESWTATHLTIVGGNQQGGAVTRMTVPRLRSNGGQVLGYRRPVAAERPVAETVRHEDVQRRTVEGVGVISAFLWSVWDWAKAAASAVGEFIGILPETASSVSTTVTSGQQLTEAAGMPWPIQVGLFIAICAIVFGLMRSWRRARENRGDLTRPPYETDFEPAEDAVDMFEDAILEAAGAAEASPTARVPPRTRAMAAASRAQTRCRPAAKKAPARKPAARKPSASKARAKKAPARRKAA